MTAHPRRGKPSHITLHRQWLGAEYKEPWVIAVRMIREVMPPPMKNDFGMGSQVQIAADYSVSVKETPEEVAALIKGEG